MTNVHDFTKLQTEKDEYVVTTVPSKEMLTEISIWIARGYYLLTKIYERNVVILRFRRRKFKVLLNEVMPIKKCVKNNNTL